MAAKNDASKEAKDNVVKAPDTPVPGDRTNWADDGRTGTPVGATNLDPLGTSTEQPTNAVADPTDNRAIPKQSERNVKVEEGPKSHVEGKVPTASGMLADPKQYPAGSAGAAPAAFLTGPINMPKPKMLKGKTVQLTAPHYIGDQVYDTGAVFEQYHGPLSRNMLVEGEDGFEAPQTAQEREQIMFHLRGPRR
jgi:hypothetical protein